MALENTTQSGDRAVHVVGHRLHIERDPSGAIPLVGDLLVLYALKLTGALLDRALDVLGRHVGRFGRVHRQTQPGVAVEVPAGSAGGHRDLTDQFRETLTALGIEDSLLALDLLPLAVTSHGDTPRAASGRPARLRSGSLGGGEVEPHGFRRWSFVVRGRIANLMTDRRSNQSHDPVVRPPFGE